jgi:hypothetical protein
MKTIKAVMFAALVIAGAACKKDDDKAGGGAAKTGEGGGGGAKLAGNFPAEWQKWDLPARMAAWQGAWAGEGGGLGVKAAWQITGNKVTYVDKGGEKQLAFSLESPCTAKLTETTADGASSSTIPTYTLKDGALITGLGSAGQKQGDSAIVCASGNVYTVDAKGCQEWSSMFDKWEAKPGTCGFRKDGDKDVFFYTSFGSESTLDVDGDVIWSEQLRDAHAAKHPDLAAAKAAQGL